MKTIAIEGTLRESLGGSSAKQLRNQGMIPCVIYGGEENVHFYTPEANFRDILYTPEVFNITVKLDGKEYNTVIRQTQFHPVTDQLEHVDFLELVPNKVVTISVPVLLTGNARGVRNGGRLKVNLRRVRVKATPENLPGQIEVDITNLRIGGTIRVSDVPVSGFVVDHEPTRTICLIQTGRNVVEDSEEEEEGTEAAAEGEATAEAAPAESGAEA